MNEQDKPKRKARDDPWYQLATRHGEPISERDESAQKNQIFWSRRMASRISDDFKAPLREKGWLEEELTPLSEGWHDALLRDQAACLDFLVTQRAAASPQVLIGSTHFQNLLMDLQDAYQLITLSGASALSSDTLALAREVSVTMLIIRVGNASRTAAREASLRIAAISRCRPLITLIAGA